MLAALIDPPLHYPRNIFRKFLVEYFVGSDYFDFKIFDRLVNGGREPHNLGQWDLDFGDISHWEVLPFTAPTVSP